MQLSLPPSVRRRQANKVFRPSLQGRGVEFRPENLSFIPAESKIRPLRDQLVIEPMDVTYSNVIAVLHNTKPLRGRVLAVGPGTYWKIYNHQDKHKRSSFRESKVFRPTEVKVGDIVELGGAEISGYSFECIMWGEKLVIFGASERDVAGVLNG